MAKTLSELKERFCRLEKDYSGSDGPIGVVDVRTQTGMITGPLVELCFFPNTEELLTYSHINGRRRHRQYAQRLDVRYE